jgi:Y-X(10)_GDL-associated radical SAM protein
MTLPRRFLTADDEAERRPVHAVWEITLACDLKCSHCGSRAGPRRANELSTAEALDLVRKLATLGTRHVTLIGGEAYLRRDWLEIVRAIRGEGMDCTLQTGGLHLTAERIDAAAGAGLQGVGVSIDGLAPLHDRLRGVRGSFDAAFAVLRHARARGLKISANSQITAPVVAELRPLFELLIGAGVEHWQVQLTVAMGRAADHPELLLQPYQLLTLMPILAELFTEGLGRGLLLQPGNNIGYFGPYESLWRGRGDERLHWNGCSAGQTGMGIEADGTIKGCPSLPTTTYSGGNVRDLPLETIWASAPEIHFRGSPRELWGFCGSCYYADVCEAGCTWTSHSLLGKPGNNPYCHHRALELERQGLRERVVQVEAAPGRSFDHGRFALMVERLDGSAAMPSPETAPRVGMRTSRRLRPCRGCNRHVFAGTRRCPHCGGDVRALAAEHAKKARRARDAYARLSALMKGLSGSPSAAARRRRASPAGSASRSG